MNSSEYYIETLKLQRQAAQEQTSIITEIKNTFAEAGAEQTEVLEDGFKLLSEKIEKIVFPQNQESSPASQRSGNTYITIQSPYWDYYYWWWQYCYYYNS